MKRIKDIGEQGLIEKFSAGFKTAGHTVAGIGDDAAVIDMPGQNKLTLFTCDTMVAGVHFAKNEKNWYRIGQKAVGQAISDIAAMSGTPVSAVISLAVPKNAKVKHINQFVRGANAMACRCGIDIVGGDTVDSRGPAVISVAVIGTVEKGRLARRTGARAGDKIMVTGSLGGSREGKQYKFLPRIREARWLTGHGRISAMIDISDGLVIDLYRLVSASKTGALLYQEKIPVSRAAKKLPNALLRALGDGEDFELLVVSSDSEGLIRKWPDKKVPLTVIGEITRDRGKVFLVDKGGAKRKVPCYGYEHFK